MSVIYEKVGQRSRSFHRQDVPNNEFHAGPSLTRRVMIYLDLKILRTEFI